MSKNKTVIHLSDHFTTDRLLRYALPSIGMMIFTSVYSVVDGFFVSNIVGKTSFAAVNLILPVLEILGALGYVFGTGGSALVSKELGEGRREEASETFSLMVCTTIAVGVFVAAVGTPLLRPILSAIGARGAMLEEALAYGRILTEAGEVDGIVIVTSPQELVSMIVEKAVKMAKLMNIPILGLVENMSYFECPDCGKRHEIFGHSHIAEIADQYQLPVLARIPIVPTLAAECDAGSIESVEGDWLDQAAQNILEANGEA